MTDDQWTTRTEEEARSAEELKNDSEALVSNLYPLDFAGMPAPGAFFPKFALALYHEYRLPIEQSVLRLYAEILYGKLPSVFIEMKTDVRAATSVIAGHLYGNPVSKGPVPASVMVVGKMPRPDDLFPPPEAYRYSGDGVSDFIPAVLNPGSSSGAFFRQQCLLRRADPSGWYVTYLFKGLHPENPETGSTLKTAWLKEWYPILHQELRIVQPEYLLLFGADVAKLFFGSKTKIEDVNGRVLNYSYTCLVDGKVCEKSAKVIVTTAPSAVVRAAGTKELNSFEFAFTKFVQLCSGGEQPAGRTEETDHRVVKTIGQWRELVKEIEVSCEDNLIAVDAEWHGQHPQCSGAYLLSVQLSWKPKTAAALLLRDDEGRPVFNEAELIEIKEAFYKLISAHVVAGHYVDSDFEFLIAEGFIPSIAHVPFVPSSAEGYREAVKERRPCLFDTAIAAHACDETQDFSLTAQYLQNCPDVPRYDHVLEMWKTDYCTEHGLKKKEFPGYGVIPNDVLMPYACYDADVTRRLAEIYIKRLDCDRLGFDCWRPFHITMAQFNAFLEINCNGILVDRERLSALTALYDKKAAQLLEEIRREVRWPDLNMNSPYQFRELLFGPELNGKNGVQLRPEGALTLRLTPVITTGTATPWSVIVRERREHTVSPSCNKRTLSILYSEGAKRDYMLPSGKTATIDWTELIGKIRDYRILNHLGTYVLKVPEAGAPAVPDSVPAAESGDEEDLVYDGGIPAYICDTDNRLRTHMYATKETGRASSARPNLQNLSKQREADYARIVGDEYIGPLRSILKASDGHLLIAADYKGAELFACAVLSGDRTMYDHVMRNQLDENDPDYYDIHSAIAVMGMRLDCPPTKQGLAAIGRSDTRIGAKRIIFGMMYGQRPQAVSQMLRAEGVYVTVEEAEQMHRAIKETYPDAAAYLLRCASAVTRNPGHPGYLFGAYGRLRRCPPFALNDRDRIAAFERQFMNFPMQNFVADTVARALNNLYWERYREPVEYSILLQIHDEILVEVPYRFVEKVYDETLDKCMVDMCPVYPLNGDGQPMGTGPLRMGIDKSVYYRWSEKLSRDQWLEIVS